MMTTIRRQWSSRSDADLFKKQIERRLSRLSKESLDDLRELADELGKTDDCDERDEIAKTMMEIVYPDQLKVDAIADEEDEEARQRLETYRAGVGGCVRRRRLELKMTQEQLAAASGIVQSHISRIERGKHTTTHVTIEKLAAALKTSPGQLDPGFDP